MLKNNNVPILTEVIQCKICANYYPVSPTLGNCFYSTISQRLEDFCSHGKEKAKIELEVPNAK
jgi:hypothetical protein